MNPKPAVILSLLALGLASAFAPQSGHHALAQRHIEARGGSAALQELKVIERGWEGCSFLCGSRTFRMARGASRPR